MKNKYVFTTVLLLLLTAIGAGFVHVSTGTKTLAESEQEQLNIVTSFYPMYVATKNVAGDIPGVEVQNLTEPTTGCLHDYQLTPQDMILLSKADVFVVNGGGIESFLDDVINNYPELEIVAASVECSFLGTEQELDGHGHSHEDDREEEHEHYHGDGHDHGDVNAHVWMDVARYMQEVHVIAEALQAADPANADAYSENAHTYLGKLGDLQSEFEVLESMTEGERVIIFHDAFAYFADAFGLEVAGVIAMDGETSFSANQVSEIVELIREEQVDMLFTEEQYGTKLADAVSRETSAKVYVLDSLVTGDGHLDGYINGMNRNLEVLRNILGKEE